jgi:apolipoprotein N-acyltransferase
MRLFRGSAPLDGQRPPAGELALSLLAGVLHTASFAPLEAWWLQLLAVGLLFWRVRGLAPWAAFCAGLAFGFGWLVSGLWWLFISMHRYGGLPSPVAAAAVAVLSLALSLYLALAMAAFAHWRSGRSGPDVALFAACWLLAELARASWLTGFPWLAAGYAHTSGPLAHWAPWIGVYGLGALAAALGATLFAPWSAKADRPTLPTWPAGQGASSTGGARLRAAAVAVMVPASVLVVGAFLPQSFTASAGRMSVSLLQPNIAQDLKFDAGRMATNFDRLGRDLESARGTLVVTPESVVPLPLSMVDPDQWQRLRRAVARPGRAALVGVFTGNEQAGYVNSMVALSAASDGQGAQGYQYGKQHLLPFGEFIPFGFGWFVRAMGIPLDDQAHGTNSRPLALGSQRLRPLICYEDLFGEDIVGSVVGDDAATVFVNASNLAWFGPWMVQDQHLQFSRMRALEFERPFVRATNTGATTVIDHRGRVTARLDAGVAGILESEFEGRVGTTPYARWLAASGLWPLWGLALAVLAWVARRPA